MYSDKLDQQRDDLINLWSLNGARSLTKNNCFFFYLLNQMDGFDALGQVKDVFHFF